MPTPEPWSILADVAAHLQVSEDTVLRWIAKRHLPANRVGRIWRFKLLARRRSIWLLIT
jgi:excisionase family DNA binding protein